MLRPLPSEVQRLCEILDAPPRLVSHLTLVHDVACQIVEQFRSRIPDLNFAGDVVCLGAAIHDLGKTLVPEELTGPGNRHEEIGPQLLEQHGIAASVARCARTHGQWKAIADLPLEELLVALADTVWRGKRDSTLEERIARLLPGEPWEMLMVVDEIVTPIANEGERRLAMQ